MADFDIKAMNWIKVKGKPINSNVLNVDEKYEVSSFESSNKEGNAPFRFLTLDIEVLSEGEPDYKKDPIIMISLVFYPSFRNLNSLVLVVKNVKKSDNSIMCFNDEIEMFKKLLEIVKDFDPDFIIGYNICDFDMPYIIKRMRHLKIKPDFGRALDKPASSEKLGEGYKNSILGRFIIDSYKIIKELVRRGFFHQLKRYGLGDVSKVLLNEEKVDIPHSQIPKYWNENIEKLIEYARKDSELAFKLFIHYKMLEKYIALSRVTGLLLQDILDGGEASKIEIMLLREFNKRDFVIPNKPKKSEVEAREIEKKAKGLKGGYVLNPEIGFNDKCVVYLDFASMYPNIIISFNICPTTLITENLENLEYLETPIGTKFVSPKIRRGIYTEVLKTLIEKRSEIKKNLKNEKDERIREYLDAMQEAFKRIANAFYGYTGFTMGRIYMLEIANSITSVGRKLIKEMKEEIERKTNYRVIYGDTDSIMVKLDTDDLKKAFEKSKEIENIVNSKYENLKMKLETIFKTILITHKKRYAGLAIDEDGKEKIVVKGMETVRRDWCDLVSETLQKILEIILREKNLEKAVNYFKKVVDDLKNNRIPIEKLMITKGISKKEDEYKGIQPHIELIKRMKQRGIRNLPGIGDRISYVIVKGTGLVSQRAEDPKYVLENNLEIDVKYYIETQLLPPLERILLAIGSNVTDAIDVGKQITLSSLTNNFTERKVEIKESLSDYEKVVCRKCNRVYRRVTISGKCWDCGSELFFSLGNFISTKIKKEDLDAEKKQVYLS